MVRSHAVVLSLAAAWLVAAACNGAMDPNSSSGLTGVGSGGSTGGGSPTGGSPSATITASSVTTGGAYGSGGNYFFSPTPDTVALGTTVTFRFGSVTHNVVFSSPTAPANIPASMDASVTRMFATAGTYNYMCTIHGFSGVLVVQ